MGGGGVRGRESRDQGWLGSEAGGGNEFAPRENLNSAMAAWKPCLGNEALARVKSDLIKVLVRGVMLFLRTSTLTC